MGSDDLFKKNKVKRSERKSQNKDKAKNTIYIFSEGTKTETQYFKAMVEYLKKLVHLARI